MKYFKIVLLIITLVISQDAYAQVGGTDTYQFLNLSSSARISGLGGNLITVYDEDVNLAFGNPSLANPKMHGRISFNHNFLLAGTSHGYIAYGHDVPKWGVTLHGGIQYINYGEFIQTDIFNNDLGQFKASEFAFTLGAGKRLFERMSVGANLKLVSSRLATFSSVGISTDLSASYILEEKNALITLVIKNTGAQISSYSENRESIPFDVQLGVSKRLQKLPFRYSLIYHNLHRWNLRYDNPYSQENTFIDFGSNPVVQENNNGSTLDNFFRHIIINGEFLIGKKENLKLRIGYNHQRRKDLTVNNVTSFSGISYGFGIRINRFRFDFGHNSYHLAGGSNHIGISTGIGEFGKRSKVNVSL